MQSTQSVGMGVLHGGSAWGGFRGARKGKQEGGQRVSKGGQMGDSWGWRRLVPVAEMRGFAGNFCTSMPWL